MENAAKSKRTSDAAARSGPDRLEEFRAEAKGAHRDAGTMFVAIEERLRGSTSLSDWLASLTATPDRTNGFATTLYEKFPTPTGHVYSNGEWTDGLTTLHLYTLHFVQRRVCFISAYVFSIVLFNISIKF